MIEREMLDCLLQLYYLAENGGGVSPDNIYEVYLYFKKRLED